LSRVEEHHASADGREFVLHFIGLDGAVFRDYLFEDSPQSRDVPLPIAQQVELSALRASWLHRESPIKGSTRGNYAQISIEHDKRLPKGVNDGLRQRMPVRDSGQRVVIRHARRFLSICGLDLIKFYGEAECRRSRHAQTFIPRRYEIATRYFRDYADIR
jgi:hypothetical protein